MQLHDRAVRCPCVVAKLYCNSCSTLPGICFHNRSTSHRQQLHSGEPVRHQSVTKADDMAGSKSTPAEKPTPAVWCPIATRAAGSLSVSVYEENAKDAA